MARLDLVADLSQLARIRRFVAKTGRDLGLDDDTIYDLQLAVDEACTNIVRHAYGGVGGEIEITIEPVEGGIRAILRDWGAEFDPGAAPIPDVTAPLELRPPGGMGLFLMQEVMDRVDFRFEGERGNTLIMEKQLAGRER
jgi:serine/threonine-protein kinase RsbW